MLQDEGQVGADLVDCDLKCGFYSRYYGTPSFIFKRNLVFKKRDSCCLMENKRLAWSPNRSLVHLRNLRDDDGLN